MKLYAGTESGNSWKVRILLEQLDVPYELVLIDMHADEHKSPAFVDAINPRGQVPVLEDDGRRFWDSSACLIYLARKFDRQDWLPVEAGDLAEIMQWVAMAGTEIQFGLQYARRGVIRDRWVIGDARSKPQYHAFGRMALDTLERRLSRHDWVALDRITVADIACFPYVSWAHEADLPLDGYPGIRAWLARCLAVPRWAAAPVPPVRISAPHPVA